MNDLFAGPRPAGSHTALRAVGKLMPAAEIA